VFGLRDKIYKKWIVIENKILLSILTRVLLKYRKTFPSYMESLPPGSIWFSTLKDEETVINQFDRVLIRRTLSATRKSSK
jgi:hypothetical protein